MSFPEALLRRRKREAWDEKLPDGSTVSDLLRQVQQRNIISGNGGQGVPLSQAPPTSQPVDDQQLAAEKTLTNQGFKGAMMRDRRTQPRDYVADDSAYLRGVMNQPRTWRDKIIDIADVVNTVAGGKPRVLPSKRERAIREAEGQLATDVELQKQALSQMVPVQLDNGQTVMVPAKSAATLQSRQQEIGLRGETLAERKAINENRKKHWDAMDSRDRKRLIISLYNSGGLNDPEMLEYAADQLGLPGNLREKFIAGQMRDAIDEEGNLIQINRQTGVVGDTGRKSFETVKEAGRERRADESVASREKVAAMPARAQARGATRVDGTTTRRVASLISVIERARREMEAADVKGDKATREKARIIGENAAIELNALEAGYEAGPGEGGYPYYKKGAQQAAPAQQGGQYSGRRISQANVAEYGRRHGMTAEQAAEFLKREGATIY